RRATLHKRLVPAERLEEAEGEEHGQSLNDCSSGREVKPTRAAGYGSLRGTTFVAVRSAGRRSALPRQYGPPRREDAYDRVGESSTPGVAQRRLSAERARDPACALRLFRNRIGKPRAPRPGREPQAHGISAGTIQPTPNAPRSGAGADTPSSVQRRTLAAGGAA